jgi:putative transposase
MISQLSKSSFFYGLKHLGYKSSKDVSLKPIIQHIFNKNHGKYGYIRMTYRLHQLGYRINRKRVYRLMKAMQLQATPKRHQYRSYRGTVGKIAPNLMNQSFETTGPYQKLGTDITQFRTKFGKLYLSPVIDFHTREVLAYDLSPNPNLAQIERMLNQLMDHHGAFIKGSMLQSDQGYQYQQKFYQKYLKDHGIIQSMSLKGNTLDNSPTESFFSRLKTEIYYDSEYRFQSLAEVKETLHRYIRYYNEERIVNHLKTSPMAYRKQLIASQK